MALRLFVQMPLSPGREMALSAGAARHAQVRRVQPGDALRLFDGSGGEWAAEVVAMTRSAVTVRVAQFIERDAELPIEVTLAVGMPAGERMDWLIEKATELGVARIQPLRCERSVLRVQGERAERKREHWQAVAVAAAEQCGRTKVPNIAPVLGFADYIAACSSTDAQRWLLSPGAASKPIALPTPGTALVLLSGPEGGMAPAEETAALAAQWQLQSLGPRILRAETAPLALLAWLGLSI